MFASAVSRLEEMASGQMLGTLPGWWVLGLFIYVFPFPSLPLKQFV